MKANSRYAKACAFLIFFLAVRGIAEVPSPQAVQGFDAYVAALQSRLAQQHRSPKVFLAPEPETRLRTGDLIIEKLTPAGSADLPGALLHHWRGTAFAPGAKAADFERLMRDFPSYSRFFAPQVTAATILNQQGALYQVRMRVHQKHVITVVLDTTYDVAFSRADPQHGSSTSLSTQISEIASPDTPSEHALSPDDQHGFLWRLDTYWSYEERDGGLYVQIESVSLTRSIPTGLGWAVRPFIESIPRESLEFTLQSVRSALRK